MGTHDHSDEICDRVASEPRPSTAVVARTAFGFAVIAMATGLVSAVATGELSLTSASPVAAGAEQSGDRPAEQGQSLAARRRVLVVGRDIEAGTYISTNSTECRWARLKGLSGRPFEILLAEEFTGTRTLTVEATDGAVVYEGCRPLRRVIGQVEDEPAGVRYPP